MNLKLTLSTLAAAGMLSPTAALASGEHADIFFGLDGSNQIVTIGEEPTENFFLSRVFEGEFDGSFSTDDPGFNNDEHDEYNPALGLTTVAASTDLVINVKAAGPVTGGTAANLWYWDGTGSADTGFAPVTDGTTLTLSELLGSGEAVADGGATDDPGFAIETTSATGALHQHIGFTLLDSTDGIGGIAHGIYVVALELAQLDAVSPSVAASEIFYIAFATEGTALDPITEEQHEEAVDYFASAFVPEPASLALLGLGGLTLLVRRRANA